MTWELKQLGEIAEVFNGKTPSKLEQRSEGFPVLKIKDVDENGKFRGPFGSFVDVELAAKHKKRHIQCGDILILNAAHNADYVGSKVFRVPDDVKGALATGEWLIIRSKADTLDSRFAYYWVLQGRTRHQIRGLVNGIHLYPSDISRLKIPLPPLAEQKRITEILDKADALREKRRQALAKLDTLLQGVFVDMFGNLATNSKGWEYDNFGSVIETLTDYHANGSYEVLRDHVELLNEPDFALMVRTTDLESSNFNSGVKYITKDAYEFLAKSKVFGGEIIINKIGSAGKAYLMPYLNRPVSLGMNQFLIRLHPGSESIFYYHVLTSAYGEAIIRSQVRGAVTKTITKEAIRKLTVPIPPRELQQEFCKRKQQISKLKSVQLSSLYRLDALISSLQEKAFKGLLSLR